MHLPFYTYLVIRYNGCILFVCPTRNEKIAHETGLFSKLENEPVLLWLTKVKQPCLSFPDSQMLIIAKITGVCIPWQNKRH